MILVVGRGNLAALEKMATGKALILLYEPGQGLHGQEMIDYLDYLRCHNVLVYTNNPTLMHAAEYVMQHDGGIWPLVFVAEGEDIWAVLEEIDPGYLAQVTLVDEYLHGNLKRLEKE